MVFSIKTHGHKNDWDPQGYADADEEEDLAAYGMREMSSEEEEEDGEESSMKTKEADEEVDDVEDELKLLERLDQERQGGLPDFNIGDLDE